MPPQAARSKVSFDRPILMLVTRPMPDDALIRVVAQAVAGGVDWVQVREKDAPVARLDRLLTRLRKVVGERARFLVNPPSGWAGGASADGLHLPEAGHSIEVARHSVGPTALVGRSVHSLDAAHRAEAEGADYLVAGQIFATGSHPGEPPRGLPFLEVIAGQVSLPVLAIGGITPENAAACLRAGAAGVAVLSGIMDAADPRSAAAAFRRALGGLGCS